MRKPLHRYLVLLAALLLAGVPTAAAQPAAPDPGPVPVATADPSWGQADAPVTLVFFSDLQCPFCMKAAATLGELRQQYGPKKLRIVFKHFPLAFHPKARPAAEAAEAARMLGGNAAFWTFTEQAFTALSSGQQGSWQDAAVAATLDPQKLQQAIDGGKPAKKVDADLALGQSIGVQGTPASYVNGVLLSGAQEKSKFEALIDQQLAEAAAARTSGVPASRIYAELSKKGYVKPTSPTPSAAPGPTANTADTTTVWQVPVGASPQKGPKDAPVTLVTFMDFQCPFCRKLAATLAQLDQKYPGKLRFVFKHHPLPFHQRAEPAHELAAEAFARKGHAGFWAAYDKLFAQAAISLEDADLEQVARDVGLDAAAAMAAVQQKKHAKGIEDDEGLAEDLEAKGTPTSYVNGRRLSGAQPVAAFERLVDEELEHSKQLASKGVAAAAIYDSIVKNGKTAPLPPEKTVPAPTADNPSRGPAQARVTIQMFTDFQCPFCSRVVATLGEVEKAYPGKVRLVFRNLPMPFHTYAKDAHTVAMEAFEQKGAKGFWKLHDVLFANQSSLTRTDLLGYAKDAGLDVAKVQLALDTGRHAKRIEADQKIAADADIRGTPGFVVNGYFLSGAQPLSRFKRVIDLALKKKR